MKIEFVPSSEAAKNYVSPPIPAKNFIPKWYKQIETINEKKIKIDDRGVAYNKNVKNCMPFLDALMSGYIQRTWTDIYIENDQQDGSIKYYWASGPQILHHRDNHNLPIENEFYPIEFIWKEQWVPKLPKGYSMIYTHPLNRIDLPFLSLSGVVDSDLYHHSFNGNYPFYIKKDFVGIIPAGTPMYQMIPMKRELWEAIELPFNELENNKKQHQIINKFVNRYKNSFWSKKRYE